MKIKNYKHTLNGKSYIGQTCKPLSKRFGKDFSGYKNCVAFYNAVQKYGPDAVQNEVLYVAEDIDEANRLEVLCIARYNTITPNGYNLTTGGSSGHHTAETRAKLSAANMGEKNPRGMQGKTHTAESRAKMSVAKSGENHPLYGKTPSAETRAKLSAANTGENHPRGMQGKTHSPEARLKMSAAHKGKPKSAEARLKQSETIIRNRGQLLLFGSMIDES